MILVPKMTALYEQITLRTISKSENTKYTWASLLPIHTHSNTGDTDNNASLPLLSHSVELESAHPQLLQIYPQDPEHQPVQLPNTQN